MFRKQDLCPGRRNNFHLSQNAFLSPSSKIVNATYVSRAAQLGNICFPNNIFKVSQSFMVINVQLSF